MEVDDEAFIAEELVEELAAEVGEANNQQGVPAEVLTDKEINKIQVELCSIEQPSWHHGPPKKLGDVEYGKLNAEQW